MNLRALLCGLALWLVCGSVRAQEALELSTMAGRNLLATRVSVLEDADGKLDFAHVSAPDAAFHPNSREGLSFGFSYAAVWVRFQARNDGTHPVRWLLELEEPSLDDVQLYVWRQDGRVERHQAGDVVPFARRELGTASPTFELVGEPGELVEFFLRVQSDDVLRLPLVAWQPGAYVASHEREQVAQWLFYGALLMLALHNLGVFMTVRHAEHLFYALSALMMCLVLVSLHGHQAQLLFPEHAGLCARLGPLSMALATLFITLFMSAVVSRLAHRRSVEHHFRAASWAAAGLTVFSALAPIGLCFRVLSALFFAVGLVGPVLLRMLHAFPLPELNLYRRSWFGLCIAMPLTVLRYGDLLPDWPLLVWVLPVGFVAHGITTSLALASLASSMRLALSKMNEQLVANVEELRLALARAEQANDAAQRATKAKDEFLATMSHELRTPLNAIINIPQGLVGEFTMLRGARCKACQASFVLDEQEHLDAGTTCGACHERGTLEPQERVKYRGDEARYLRFLEKIERSGQHLLQMINGVLDFSKLEAGRFELELAPVDLDALIREVCDQVVDLAQRKGIQIEVESQVERAPLLADVLRLKQVLINLLANAIKFSDAGTAVTVRWLTRADAELIEVEDRGIGIADTDHERIFASFEQVHAGDTRKYGGTGLGLSIARSLVRMHGGELSVRSELGKGSTFEVRLPPARAEHSANTNELPLETSRAS